MLTSHDNESDIFASFAAGADGYVLKDAYASTLELAIRTVRFGSVWLDPAIAQRVLQLATQHVPLAATTGCEPLSQKEKEVLNTVAGSHCEKGLCMIEPAFLDKIRRFAPATK